MEKTERAGLQVKMDVLLQTAEESCLLGSDAWYGKLRDVVYALYEQKEIPLEMLIKAERRLGQLEMDVRLAEHGLTPLPQPAPEQPKQETVRASDTHRHSGARRKAVPRIFVGQGECE